jgi:gamma-glutamyltranspeptidase/glutathione hydrolase
MEPTGSGVGGDLFTIVWDAKTEKLYGLNASGDRQDINDVLF